MIKSNKVQLKDSSILNVPLQTYEKDFTFIVNDEEYKTSRLISDLLSPKICKMHKMDATLDYFVINTKNTGDFTNILQLISFKPQNIPANELLFVLEVFENLEITNIELDEDIELNEDNVFHYLYIHEKDNLLYRSSYNKEIELISSNFCNYCEEKQEKLQKLEITTIYDILNNDHLVLHDEDQLLNFVNSLYSQDIKYSILYETVNFTNVSSNAIDEFIEIYDINQLTNYTWKRICERLREGITHKNSNVNNDRYNKSKSNKVSQIRNTSKSKNNSREFSFTGNNEGIINYLRIQSDGKIEDEITATASSVVKNFYKNEEYVPINACIDNDKIFSTQNLPNSSITLYFKNYSICPTGYTVKSKGVFYFNEIPKSWVIEGSTDYLAWEIIDERRDITTLDNLFAINNQQSKSFKYIRMRQTDKNMVGSNYFCLQSIEFYGTLI